MKNILLSGCAMLAALTLASSAQAADIAPASYDWTGFYLGANAGAAWNNSSVDNNYYSSTGIPYVGFKNSLDGDETAFTAGGLLGYNYQMDKVVLGIEADLNYLGFSDSKSNSFEYPSSPGLPYTTTSSVEADWFGTIRGRLGFAVDNVLIYGTGGAAYGHVSASGKVTADFPPGGTAKTSTDSTNWGWTVGGGAEYGIDNWSLGLEYLYVDLGSDDWNYEYQPTGERLKGSADYAFSTVRASVRYRFH